MTPLTLPGQTALQPRVLAGNGTPAWAHHDYRGAVVSSFDVQGPAQRAVRAGARIGGNQSAPAPPDPLAWDELGPGADAGLVAEDPAASPRTTVDAAPAEAARNGPGTPTRWRRPRPSRPGRGSRWGTCRGNRGAEGAPGKPGTTGRATPGRSTGPATRMAADPANQASVGEDHVVVARGRDYAGVPPLKASTTARRASPRT
jgi:hypothetical protein